VTPGGARFTRAGHGWACVPYRRATAALRQSAWVGSAAGAMHVCYSYTYTNIPTEGQAIPRHAHVDVRRTENERMRGKDTVYP
jgi:hypothetical protein